MESGDEILGNRVTGYCAFSLFRHPYSVLWGLTALEDIEEMIPGRIIPIKATKEN